MVPRPHGNMKGLFIHLALFSLRRRKWIIGFWLMLAAACAPVAAHLPEVLGDHGLETDGSYLETQIKLERTFGIPADPVVMLFERDRKKSEAEFDRAILQLLRRADRISGVDVAAAPPQHAEIRNGLYKYALLSVPGAGPERKRAIEQIRSLIDGEKDDLKIYLTGKPIVQEDVNRLSRKDLMFAEMLGVPVAFIVMLLTFGGLLPALIPLIAGGISVVTAMAVVCMIGAYGDVSLSVFVYNVMPMAGMAVCLDFALLLVSRYREERASHSPRESICRMMASSGKAVTISAVCVLAALLGTFFIRMPIFNTVALGAIAVLVVAALINLTFVPAVLYALGGRIRPSRAHAGGARKGLSAGIALVMRRPGLAAIWSMVLLLVLLLPARELKVSIPGPDSLPQGTESRIAAEMIAGGSRFPSYSEAYLVAEGREKAAELRSRLEHDRRSAGVSMVSSPYEENIYLVKVRLHGSEASSEVMQWLREQEQLLGSDGVLVGGEAKYEQEVHDAIFSRLPHVIGFVIISNFAVLGIALRSLLIPLKAILMNLLSLGASFGILVWLFQEGRWGLEATDIAIMIPVFLFGLVFGISMDYGVFLLSRIYEAYRINGDVELSVREGLAASGKIITSAAVIMIAVTAPFALAGVSGVKQLGIGIAAALFIDATLIRLVLVPALMKLLGKWNWWLPRSIWPMK